MTQSAENIRRRREELGLSVDELARMIGKSRATVYRYENGEIGTLPSQVVNELSIALQTTHSYIMGLSGLKTGKKERESIARNLVRAREKAKLSLAEAAQQAGVTAEQLEQIETGAVPLSETMLIRLCAVYHVYPERIQVLDDEELERICESRQKDEQIAEYRRQLQKEQPAEPNLDELSPTKRYLIDAINRLPEDQLQVLAAVIDQVMHGRGE